MARNYRSENCEGLAVKGWVGHHMLAAVNQSVLQLFAEGGQQTSPGVKNF
jgi:hypothetical protein